MEKAKLIMKITNNFTLKELTHSTTAVAKGIKNNPGEEETENLIILANKLLQPLRDLYGKPLMVTSGYRNPQLNKLVGGVPTSQHTKGEAADLMPSGNDPRNLMNLLINSNLDWDQAILYEDGRNRFLHVSYTSSRKNRKMILYSKGTPSSNL